MIYVVLGIAIVLFALLYNHLRYKDALLAVEKLKDHLKKNCENSMDSNHIVHDKFSKSQKLFLDNFSKYMECNKLLYQLDLKMHDIFCLKIKKINRLDKLAYKFEDYYCIDVYRIIDFLDDLYHKYSINNKNLNFNTFNIQLFGKENIDDDELLSIILKMTLKEFIVNFAVLAQK